MNATRVFPFQTDTLRKYRSSRSQAVRQQLKKMKEADDTGLKKNSGWDFLKGKETRPRLCLLALNVFAGSCTLEQLAFAAAVVRAEVNIFSLFSLPLKMPMGLL